MDEDILARSGHPVGVGEQEHGKEGSGSCFYCLEGWVFLGSLDHDGEEVVEALEVIAAELERLRVLKEHQLGVRLGEAGGHGPYVPAEPVEE